MSENVNITITPNDGYAVDDFEVYYFTETPPPAMQQKGMKRRVRIYPNLISYGMFDFDMPPGDVYIKVTFTKGIWTDVPQVNASAQKGGMRYNMLGQPVGSDYRGIVIEGGRKRIVR